MSLKASCHPGEENRTSGVRWNGKERGFKRTESLLKACVAFTFVRADLQKCPTLLEVQEVLHREEVIIDSGNLSGSRRAGRTCVNQKHRQVKIPSLLCFSHSLVNKTTELLYSAILHIWTALVCSFAAEVIKIRRVKKLQIRLTGMNVKLPIPG